jgi:hypothetical protein
MCGGQAAQSMCSQGILTCGVRVGEGAQQGLFERAPSQISLMRMSLHLSRHSCSRDVLHHIAPPAFASLSLSRLRRPPSSLPIHLYCMPCSASSCSSRASLLNCSH